MNIRSWIKSQPAHIVLIAINVVVFAIQNISSIVLGLFNAVDLDQFNKWFYLYSKTEIFITKPWGLFTHMFMHKDLPHLFWNMLFVFLIGRAFEKYFNKRTLYSLFIVSGLVAGLVTVISYNIFPALQDTNAQMQGASGAVYAIILGLTAYNHKAHVPIVGPIAIPLLIFSVVKILGDLSSFHLGNTGGHIAHLAGATYGIVFGLKYRQGKNILTWYQNLIAKFSKKNQYNSQMKVIHHKNVKHMKDEDYNYHKQSNEQKLNDILDKVGKSGYDSLTKAEKDFLNFMSNK